MTIVKNKIVPFGSFVAMAMWPFIFCKRDLTSIEINHEEIHGRQQRELWLIGFYILYVLFWIIEVFRCAYDKNRGIDGIYKSKGYWDRVYKANPFEWEAYRCQWVAEYLKTREKFAWWKLYKTTR